MARKLVECWTDGSSKAAGSGWAALIDGKLVSGALPKGTTNNQAELHAIFEVVQRVPPESIAVIFTDSSLAIKAVSKKSRLDSQLLQDVVDCIKLVVECKNLQVHFHRVKGHSNELKNAVVDTAAGLAAQVR
jgi:ribonuclease HI